MSLSPDQATSVLHDIAAVENRSQRAFAYREASPHLMLWGVLWAVGYGATAVTLRHRMAIWIATLAIGIGAGFLIGLRAAVQRDARVDAPDDPTRRRAVARLRQVGAFMPLVVAAGYAVLGLWCGLRFVLVGAVLAVLTLGGFFLLPTQFALWMAAVGGGALVLGGSWLRQV